MNMFNVFRGLGTIFFFLNLAIFIYIIYLFHTLTMSNKKMAETLEKISEQLERFNK